MKDTQSEQKDSAIQGQYTYNNLLKRENELRYSIVSENLILFNYKILKNIKKENYKHAAYICLHNTTNIISKGINQNNENLKSSIHAEKNCIDNLPRIKLLRKKPITIDIYIGRFSINTDNPYLISKPCNNCLQNMQKLIPIKGYKLVDVYYTTGETNFSIKTNMCELNNQEQYFTKAMKKYNMTKNII